MAFKWLKRVFYLLLCGIFLVNCRNVELEEQNGVFDADQVYHMYSIENRGRDLGSENPYLETTVSARFKYGGESSSDYLLPFDATIRVSAGSLSYAYNDALGYGSYSLTTTDFKNDSQYLTPDFTLSFENGSTYTNTFDFSAFPTMQPASLAVESTGQVSLVLTAPYFHADATYSFSRYGKDTGTDFDVDLPASPSGEEGFVTILFDASKLGFTSSTNRNFMSFYMTVTRSSALSGTGGQGTLTESHQFRIPIASYN